MKAIYKGQPVLTVEDHCPVNLIQPKGTPDWLWAATVARWWTQDAPQYAIRSESKRIEFSLWLEFKATGRIRSFHEMFFGSK